MSKLAFSGSRHLRTISSWMAAATWAAAATARAARASAARAAASRTMSVGGDQWSKRRKEKKLISKQKHRKKFTSAFFFFLLSLQKHFVEIIKNGNLDFWKTNFAFFSRRPGEFFIYWVQVPSVTWKWAQSDSESYTCIIFYENIAVKKVSLEETLRLKACWHRDLNLQPSEPLLLSLQVHFLTGFRPHAGKVGPFQVARTLGAWPLGKLESVFGTGTCTYLLDKNNF